MHDDVMHDNAHTKSSAAQNSSLIHWQVLGQVKVEGVYQDANGWTAMHRQSTPGTLVLLFTLAAA